MNLDASSTDFLSAFPFLKKIGAGVIARQSRNQSGAAVVTSCRLKVAGWLGTTTLQPATCNREHLRRKASNGGIVVQGEAKPLSLKRLKASGR
jgi:hypothetical protein